MASCLPPARSSIILMRKMRIHRYIRHLGVGTPTAVIIVHAKVLPVFEKGLSSCNVININWFV